MSKLTAALGLGVSFQLESWEQYSADAPALWQQHWLELAGDPARMPMGPDVAFYSVCDASGALCILTARAKGVLVGYCLVVVRPHPHYRTVLCGFEDSYWLAPEWRRGRTGWLLLQETERALRKRGVQRIFFMTKMSHNLGKLFTRLGFVKTDETYSKWIGV